MLCSYILGITLFMLTCVLVVVYILLVVSCSLFVLVEPKVVKPFTLI